MGKVTKPARRNPEDKGSSLSAFGLAYLLSRIILSLAPEGAGRRASLILPGILGGTALFIGIQSGSSLWFAGLYVMGGGPLVRQMSGLFSGDVRPGPKTLWFSHCFELRALRCLHLSLHRGYRILDHLLG